MFSVSCHLAVLPRSPFSGRFAASEISCPQISLRGSPLPQRWILTLWRLTRCCVRCRREPKGQSWPRSYIRWSRWLDHFFTAAKLLKGVGAGGLELDLLKAKGPRNLKAASHSEGAWVPRGRLRIGPETPRSRRTYGVGLGPRKSCEPGSTLAAGGRCCIRGVTSHLANALLRAASPPLHEHMLAMHELLSFV